MSSDIIASDHLMQGGATRAKETKSGISHSFSVSNYLPDLNRPSFACEHRPFLLLARTLRGAVQETRYFYVTSKQQSINGTK